MIGACACNRKHCNTCALRKVRKRAVKEALVHGTTVPYSMETLLDDGWSNGTIRKVWRSANPRCERVLKCVDYLPKCKVCEGSTTIFDARPVSPT